MPPQSDMTGEQALAMIDEALRRSVNKPLQPMDTSADLVKEGYLDSLDAMAFLYELEQIHGRPLEQIGEDYSDFRVASLVEILMSA